MDKKPDLAASEFKYMTQGACSVGELLVTFTILTQTENSAVIRSALEMLSTASQPK